MASTRKEVAKELFSYLRIHSDGSVERYHTSYVPPSPDQDPETGVSSKDIIISQNPSISARLYLPKLALSNQKLPILLYIHGGGFCVDSAFSYNNHRYVNLLVSQAQVIAVSVEYRLAPEHYLPAAYEDGWAALQWIASHKIEDDSTKESWLLNNGDFDRVYVGGDSAGGNLAYSVVMRAGEESLNGGVKILGAFLSTPYFWGPKPIGSEPTENHEKSLGFVIWEFVYPSAPGGVDNPMINPLGPGKPTLAKLGCSRLLVCVAEKDQLRDRGVCFFNAVKESGFRGEVELIESEGKDHAFHLFNPKRENAKVFIKRLASFLNN